MIPINPEAIGDKHATPVVSLGEEEGKALGIRQRTFGRRNPHCSNCGDERGGPFGHEVSECLYRSGMTAEELARTMPPEKAARYWSVIVDRYLDEQLAAAQHRDDPS